MRDSASDRQAAQAKPASPPPAAPGEGFKLGAYDVRTSFEVGYRWTSAIDGNEQMYRSQVNLFEGARLFNSYLTMRSTPGTGMFDRLDLSVNNIGDPYDTVRLNMSRMDALPVPGQLPGPELFQLYIQLCQSAPGPGELVSPAQPGRQLPDGRLRVAALPQPQDRAVRGVFPQHGHPARVSPRSA